MTVAKLPVIILIIIIIKIRIAVVPLCRERGGEIHNRIKRDLKKTIIFILTLF